MSPTTLALVLSGALCHACWNILAKRAAGGAMFVWLQSVVSAFTLVPLALWLGFSQGQSFSTAMLWAALASGPSEPGAPSGAAIFTRPAVAAAISTASS